MTLTPRLKIGLGYAMTAISAFASVATSTSPDVTELSLPDESVVLAAAAPEARQRFRIETESGKFRLYSRFETEQSAAPSLKLSTINEAGGLAEIESASVSPLNPRVASISTIVDMPCVNEFPCVAILEVAATADVTATDTVTGTLSTSVYFNASYRDDAYLAIEPL